MSMWHRQAIGSTVLQCRTSNSMHLLCSPHSALNAVSWPDRWPMHCIHHVCCVFLWHASSWTCSNVVHETGHGSIKHPSYYCTYIHTYVCWLESQLILPVTCLPSEMYRWLSLEQPPHVYPHPPWLQDDLPGQQTWISLPRHFFAAIGESVLHGCGVSAEVDVLVCVHMFVFYSLLSVSPYTTNPMHRCIRKYMCTCICTCVPAMYMYVRQRHEVLCGWHHVSPTQKLCLCYHMYLSMYVQYVRTNTGRACLHVTS